MALSRPVHGFESRRERHEIKGLRFFPLFRVAVGHRLRSNGSAAAPPRKQRRQVHRQDLRAPTLSQNAAYEQTPEATEPFVIQRQPRAGTLRREAPGDARVHATPHPGVHQFLKRNDFQNLTSHDAIKAWGGLRLELKPVTEPKFKIIRHQPNCYRLARSECSPDQLRWLIVARLNMYRARHGGADDRGGRALSATKTFPYRSSKTACVVPHG
jgi:hypothetical protein